MPNFTGLLERIIGGDWTWSALPIATAVNTFHAALTFAVAVPYFKDEKILFRT